MKNKKEDLRIIKTKKSLYASLLLLMKEKSFEDIKVSDICEHAYINRSTFYAHFEDKYTLLDALIRDLKKDLTEELSKNTNISNSKEYYMELIKILLDHVESQKEVYMPIMINNRNSIAMDMIFNTLNEEITKRLEQDKVLHPKKIPSEFIAKFYLGAIINIGMDWLKGQNHDNREDIIKYLDELIPDNLAMKK